MIQAHPLPLGAVPAVVGDGDYIMNPALYVCNFISWYHSKQ